VVAQDSAIATREEGGGLVGERDVGGAGEGINAAVDADQTTALKTAPDGAATDPCVKKLNSRHPRMLRPCDGIYPLLDGGTGANPYPHTADQRNRMWRRGAHSGALGATF
jgi:hypothetical protein